MRFFRVKIPQNPKWIGKQSMSIFSQGSKMLQVDLVLADEQLFDLISKYKKGL
jgi:hypothetical protein